MNSFANTTITLLLGWLRTFINNLWTIAGSAGGGTLFQFVAANWKFIVLFICICGIGIDLVIYFFRWRPYYVWNSKLGRLTKGKRKKSATDTHEPFAAHIEQQPAQHASVAHEQNESYESFFQPPEPAEAVTVAHDETITFAPQASNHNQTMTYAPQGYAQPEPSESFDPVFDDAPASWADETFVRPIHENAYQNPNHDMEGTFGMPMPEPINSLRDLHAGFAQPYVPEPAPPQVVETKAPVHPGLDSDAFRQNFGLSPAGSLSDFVSSEADDNDLQDDNANSFFPFASHMSNSESNQAKSRNPFANFAKKARNLVGGEDEDNPPTIRDLQATVDMRSAFHDPVYPERKDIESGDY